MNRRQFLGIMAAAGLNVGVAHAGRRRPEAEETPYEIVMPEFMTGIISERNITYLNETIPAVFKAHRQLFPMMDSPPQYIVLNTENEALVHHGGTLVAPDLLSNEAMTLFDVQYLMATTRFSSVATPHRGDNLDNFGQFVYLKQHPQKGYRPPEHLLLEEMLHAQQDMTVMRWIIEQEAHNPTSCLHAQLKGISELGAHVVTDVMTAREDYVFVLDDGTHCETAANAVGILAERLQTSIDTLSNALMHNVDAYATLDAGSMTREKKHIWEMVTTWRYSRDAGGNPIDLAPAFVPF
ncbi:MAG: hypothetical protein AAF787_14545 [Chloroflexota bacterium]